MSEQETRDTLERYFQAFTRHDLDAIAELVDDDYVIEYPQSGERIRGKHNWREFSENYPGGLPDMITYSYKACGDLGFCEMTLEYDGQRMYACEILEVQEGKLKSQRAYFGEPFESPQWRAQWVEKM